MENQPQRFPISVVFFAAVVTGIIVFLATRYEYKERPEMRQAVERKQTAQSKIDSVRHQKTTTVKNHVKSFTKQAKISDSLVKKLKRNEKPIIRDTSDAAMRRYITGYRYPITIDAETRQP